MRKENFGALEETIGYRFRDQDLLKTALTHSSYSNEKKSKGVDVECNERLEFLGDSVLSIITSTYIYGEYEDFREGDLTKTRAAVVCEKALSKYAGAIGLGDFIFLGHGEDMNRGRER
ncbi:MAG: ribonuclease III, partial [Clostridia bacterium]|nr:ribonuclease III [Clostridia bacterium]